MARPLRLDFADATHHITSRGNERKDIFHNDRDREKFLEYLAETVRRYGWLITAWVLMSNHFHLVLETPSPTLSPACSGCSVRTASGSIRSTNAPDISSAIASTASSSTR